MTLQQQEQQPQQIEKKYKVYLSTTVDPEIKEGID
jgi:hypothetical protein